MRISQDYLQYRQYYVVKICNQKFWPCNSNLHSILNGHSDAILTEDFLRVFLKCSQNLKSFELMSSGAIYLELGISFLASSNSISFDNFQDRIFHNRLLVICNLNAIDDFDSERMKDGLFDRKIQNLALLTRSCSSLTLQARFYTQVVFFRTQF